MKTDFIQGLRRRSGIRFGALAASAALAALLSGCGGGDGSGSAVAATSAPQSTAKIVAADADVRQKVLFSGATKGFVASALAASLPAGTEADYDVLVIGDADKGGSATLELARKALDAGKEVVFDAASDGSAQSTHAKTLMTLVGTSIDSAAVRVQKAEAGGYYVTPIDAPALAMKKLQLASAKESNPSSNSVQSVFGIQNKESTQ